MAHVVITTWIWGEEYTTALADRTFTQVKKFVPNEHTYSYVCFSDRSFIPTQPDIKVVVVSPTKDFGGCTRRLEMFDPEFTQKYLGDLATIDVMINVDLDSTIQGSLESVVTKALQHDFCILTGTVDLTKYNGSLYSIKPSKHPEVWSSLTQEAYNVVKRARQGTDQAWLMYVIKGAPQFDYTDGIYQIKTLLKIPPSVLVQYPPSIIFCAEGYKPMLSVGVSPRRVRSK